MDRKRTAAELADCFLNMREVQNLMGKYVFNIMVCQEENIYEEYWTKTMPNPALGVNCGWYRGSEAIRGYYEGISKKTAVASRVMKEVQPSHLGDKTGEEIYGVGRLNVRPLTNPIVELARDGQTAKGFWQVMGVNNEITECGPLSTWKWGYVGADFVCEDGEWKIWHLLTVDDITAPVASDWANPARYPVIPEFSGICDISIPAPTEQKEIFPAYTVTRPFTPPIPMPKPYRTFSETFSYGDYGAEVEK